MASTPGGLRFEAGTKPWLEGIAGYLVLAQEHSSDEAIKTDKPVLEKSVKTVVIPLSSNR